MPKSVIPDSAQWILHIDLKEFQTTTLYSQLETMKQDGLQEVKRKFFEKLKMNLDKDIDSITVFGNGINEKDAVVAITGNFNETNLLSLARAEKVDLAENRYGNYTLYGFQKKGFGTFVNNHLLLFSPSQKALELALDVQQNKIPNLSKNPLIKEIASIPDRTFLMLFAHNLDKVLKDNPGHSQILKMARMAMLISLEKNDNLKAQLKLTTDSAETAQSIMQIAQGLLALGRLKIADEPELQSFLNKLNIQSQGNTLVAEFEYPSKDLIKMLSEHKENHSNHQHKEK
jgi:hypothetical protein